jgi:hypothetical protein
LVILSSFLLTLVSALLLEWPAAALFLAVPTFFLLIRAGRQYLILPLISSLFIILVHVPIVISWVHIDIFGLSASALLWFFAVTIPAGILLIGCGQSMTAMKLLCFMCISFLMLAAAMTGGWLTVHAMTSSAVRIFLPGLIVLCTLLFLKPEFEVPVRGRLSAAQTWLLATVSGLLAAWSVPFVPVKSVYFDEAHGSWATIHADDGPNVYGRSSNYSYSRLSAYSQRLVGAVHAFLEESSELPTPNGIFIMKMPSRELGQEFRDRLLAWVAEGGRLLIVADHTDLYDHAQHLNLFLAQVGVTSLQSHAVFDRNGLPVRPSTPRFFSIVGRIDANDTPLQWLTGTSAARLPFTSVPLALYGPSFSEPGNYGRNNRFGYFEPDGRFSYGPHTAIVAFPYRAGVVSLMLDSTSWSNFSLFRDEFRQTFRGILAALEYPHAIRYFGSLVSIVAFLTLWAAVRPSDKWAAIFLAIIFGVCAGLGYRISSSAVSAPVQGRDYSLRVVIGSAANTEFLSQLLPPGTRNYSRIISSMAKFGLDPALRPSRDEAIKLHEAERWLLIEPDILQLPNMLDVFRHLREGRDLTILFGPEAATKVALREWLTSGDLALENSTALAVSENAWRSGPSSFTERNGTTLFRDSRVVTTARSTGLLQEHAFDRLWQTYTLRGLAEERRSGRLTIGFSADQISDFAIGDVWEGIEPNSLAVLRERQLGDLLTNGSSSLSWPSNLARRTSDHQSQPRLTNVIVVENGNIIYDSSIRARVPAQAQRNIGFADDPDAYLAGLRNQAIAHITAHCPASEDQITNCTVRLLSSDMVEWRIIRSDLRNTLIGLELIHDGRWSGGGSSINIVFGE